ncbi:hypothetical protein JCM8097_004865 [Rhodosporidiobolus ruineniae]
MGLRSWWRTEWQEAKDAGREIWSFAREHDWKKSARNSVRRKYWVWWIAAVVAAVCIALIAYYRDTIVEKFEPHKDQIVNFPASWVFPIIILVILSFPPLGGHEVVILVIGLIWGIWIGFAITCAGTLIGEVLCFFLFKYLLTNRAAQVEEKSIFYACIARLMRHGGLWIIIVVRFSAIPGHVVTAIQSTVGMSVWIYSIAVIVSLPKQLAVVYLGAQFGATDANGKKTSHSGVSLAVFAVTCLATVLALYIVYMRARKLYPEVLRDMEERGASKDSLAAAGSEEDISGPSGGPRRHPHAPRRRSSLVEAGFEGDEGIPYIAPENAQHPCPGGRGGAHPMVRTNTGGTWRSSFDDDEMRGHREQERREEERRGAWQDGAGYGRLGGESQSSFAHLPLASESEVGVTPRPGAPSAPPSYVSRPAGPYADPFANPSQQSLASYPQPQPYGGAIYGPSSSTVSIALDRPPAGPSHSSPVPASIPYLAPPPSGGNGGSGSRPTSVGGTEIMTGVGAGGAAQRTVGGGGGDGGRYGATGERR